jgi:hypothetical protein
LDKFQQHALGTDGELVIAFGVNECDIIPSGTLADASRSKPHSFCSKISIGSSQIIDPEPNVIERRDVNLVE